jgi:hypothetical protein
MEEIDYYRTQSGLSDVTLSQADYEYEYFKNVSGLPDGLSIDDYKQKFFFDETGYPQVVDGEYWYYANETENTDFQLSLEDLKRIFFNMQ